MDSIEHRIDGKMCIVTGGNSGIGKATALGLAELGGSIIIVCRNKREGEATQSDIKTKSGNENVHLLAADLSSMQSIRQLADDFKRTYQKLHVLVNNAGEILTKRHVTVDGFERTFASSHLGHFLLTNLLLDVIKASAPARIVNITSSAHRGARIHFDDLHGEKKYSAFQAYGQAKLANVLFTYELAKRMKGTGVTVNCLHPGVVRTGFGHDDPGLLSLGIWVASPFYMSAEKAVKAVVRLATSPELEGVTGKYFSKMKEARSSEESYDEEVAQRMWKLSEELAAS
ncbi:MAG TPA: SDR family oxidoreductase [Candidatus Bathyarchaeia archaeon]|nr:SDR family oxidoreductase [Candidatus Bathyarchaeia archaeon]